MSVEMLTVDPLNLLAILGMAAVTLLTRFAGYLAIGRMALTGRLKAALESVPPAVLASLIAPMVLTTGIAESLAAAITVLAAWRLPTLVAVGLGVASVVALRLWLGG